MSKNIKLKVPLSSIHGFYIVGFGITILISIGFVKTECHNPPTFGSFTGKPAANINDCFWDFVGCKRQNSIGSTTVFRKGRMVSRINKNGRDPSCCQTRYHQCCDHVNGTPVLNNPVTTPRPQTTRPTPVTPATPRSVCPKTTPSNLIGCIWQFNCCIQEKSDLGKSEKVCYKTFNRCKMIVMGMMPMDDDDDENNSNKGETEETNEDDEGNNLNNEQYTEELPSVMIIPGIVSPGTPSNTETQSSTMSLPSPNRPNKQRSPLGNCISENSRCVQNRQRGRMSMPGCSMRYSQCVSRATSLFRSSRKKYKP